MHKTTIYLDEALWDRLRAFAEAQGRTQAAVIREALHAYVAGPRRQARSVGLGRSGAGDLSERVEELLEDMGEDEAR